MATRVTLLVDKLKGVNVCAHASCLMKLRMRSYGIWSGVGIDVISLIGYFLYRQSLDLLALPDIALILAGTLVIKRFSKSRA